MNAFLVRNFLWPMQERLRGRPTPALLRHLRSGEWLSPKEIARRQLDALRCVLLHAGRSVPYYRQLFHSVGFKPESLSSPADLRHVPFLTRDIIRRHLEDLVDPAARHRLRRHATSGSTGEPLRFYIDRRRTAADNAARARAWIWWGVAPGDRQVHFWGGRQELPSRARRLADRLLNLLTLPATDLSNDALAETLRVLVRFQPRVIFGYAFALGRLAEFVLEGGGRDPELDRLRRGLRVVVATAEPLLPHHRRAIAEAFCCGVATEYGSRECGVLAGECPAGALHLAAENALVEVVEPSTGRPLPPGQIGELVITLLGEYGMPFIRYRVGDMGALSGESCSCGRTLPVLACVEGRKRDLIPLPDGRLLHPSLFSRALAEVLGLSRYQVVQTSPHRITIRLSGVSPGRGGGPGAAVEDALRLALDRIRAELGPEVALDVEWVDDLRPGPGGKFRWVVALAGEGGERSGSLE